jgi:hypothetical protein
MGKGTDDFEAGNSSVWEEGQLARRSKQQGYFHRSTRVGTKGGKTFMNQRSGFTLEKVIHRSTGMGGL